MKTLKLFEKVYCDESLIDVAEDLDAIYEDHPMIEKDEYGFRCGQFRVTVVWEDHE